MIKVILLAAILLYSTSSSQMIEGGWVILPDFDYNIYKETGKRISNWELNRDMKNVVLNQETIVEIEAKNGLLFASSLKNGQLILAIDKYMRSEGELYTIMYSIDVKSKAILKKERLNTINTYKDSDLEFSLIGDEKAPIMQYTWKGKTHKVIFPTEINKSQARDAHYYVSKNGYIVFDVANLSLYVFSMDKKKITKISNINYPGNHYIKGFYFPFNEYVIFLPLQTSPKKVFLYRYAEEVFYITRYQEIDNKTKDTIYSNIKNGNTYEQFLPLTKVENMDFLNLF